MTHAPALSRSLLCWRADARLPPDGVRPAQRQGVAERTLRGPVLEQRGGHKIILPSPADLSPVSAAGQSLSLLPATLNHSRRSESSAVAVASARTACT